MKGKETGCSSAPRATREGAFRPFNGRPLIGSSRSFLAAEKQSNVLLVPQGLVTTCASHGSTMFGTVACKCPTHTGTMRSESRVGTIRVLVAEGNWKRDRHWQLSGTVRNCKRLALLTCSLNGGMTKSHVEVREGTSEYMYIHVCSLDSIRVQPICYVNW
jgi:hypothetical protein